jgi:hypothetical protein
MRLADVEEPMSDAVAAILGQQDAFGAVEDVPQIEAGSREGGGEVARVILHGRAGRRADQRSPSKAPTRIAPGLVR